MRFLQQVFAIVASLTMKGAQNHYVQFHQCSDKSLSHTRINSLQCICYLGWKNKLVNFLLFLKWICILTSAPCLCIHTMLPMTPMKNNTGFFLEVWEGEKQEKKFKGRCCSFQSLQRQLSVVKGQSKWKKGRGQAALKTYTVGGSDHLARLCFPLSLSRRNFTSCEFWKWQSWQRRQK